MAQSTALDKPMNDQTLAKANEIATAITQVQQEYGLVALREQPAIVQAIRLAQGVQKLREILTPQFVEFMFMPLMGSPLGFLTDMDREGSDKRYRPEVVRDVLVEALLRGFMPTGNEFNIIAGRFYGAKAGLQRLVEEYPGLRNLRITPGVPEMAPNSTALVAFKATWTLDGEIDELVCTKTGDIDERIPVKVNSGMGPDALIGKAESKLYKRILKRLNASHARLLGPDDDDGGQTPINTTATEAPLPPAKDGQRMKLGAKNGEQTPADPASGTNAPAST